MTIEAQLPDGTILEFPDGTSDQVIQNSVRSQLGASGPVGQDPLASQAAPVNQEDPGALAAPIGTAEVLASIGSGIVAEPIAGIAGIAQAVNPFAEEGAGARAVEATREALTFQPRTKSGRRQISAVGEFLEPVGEVIETVETGLGDAAFNVTGSPAIAAAAATVPTAIFEALGGAGLVAKRGGRLGKTGREALKASSKQVNKALIESAPDIDVLKNASIAVYKEIDDIGVRVKPEAINSMLKTAIRKANKSNVDTVLTPKSAQVVELFKNEIDNRIVRNVSDLDQMRQKAQIAASSVDPSDARVGSLMIDEIDSFMDSVGEGAFIGDDAVKAENIGGKYKVARKLWGRARRAEIMQLAMEKAGRQASGFENGIRNQLRSILNNKKQSRFFSKDELSAMDDVVKGSNEQNILKLVGRLGFSEGQATNILGGLAGSAVLGPVTPVIGQISRGLAQRSTKNAAALSDAIVRAGPNGKKIAEAYLRLTPVKKRSISELSDLLLDGGANIDELLKSSSKSAKEAAELTMGRKAFGAGAVSAGVAPSATRQETINE